MVDSSLLERLGNANEIHTVSLPSSLAMMDLRRAALFYCVGKYTRACGILNDARDQISVAIEQDQDPGAYCLYGLDTGRQGEVHHMLNRVIGYYNLVAEELNSTMKDNERIELFLNCY